MGFKCSFQKVSVNKFAFYQNSRFLKIYFSSMMLAREKAFYLLYVMNTRSPFPTFIMK